MTENDTEARGVDQEGGEYSPSWYEYPIVAIGALHITYHELWRGRRTATCQECGRLSHASADRCLCGGELVENKHPEEFDDEGVRKSGMFDIFERIPAYSTLFNVVWIVGGVASVLLILNGVPQGSVLQVAAALLIGFIMSKLPRPATVGNLRRWDDV